MIAGIVGGERMRRGPIPKALQIAGFETQDLSTAEQAEHEVRRHGPGGSVLVIEAASLGEQAVHAAWSSFLDRCPTVSIVVVACGEPVAQVQKSVCGRNRILLEDPFDAAAVVAAVERASETPRMGLRRAPEARKTA